MFIRQIITANGKVHPLQFHNLPAAMKDAKVFDAETGRMLVFEDDYGHKLAVRASDIQSDYIVDYAAELRAKEELKIGDLKAELKFKQRVNGDPGLRFILDIMEGKLPPNSPPPGSPIQRA